MRGDAIMLFYYIAFQRLWGEVNGTKLYMDAASGGGRGSSTHPQGDPLDKGSPLGSWDSDRKIDEAKGIRGGPLPSGWYVVQPPKPYPEYNWSMGAELVPTATSLIRRIETEPNLKIEVTSRNGFFIHGPGHKGSDGCIVPFKKADFYKLMEALKGDTPIALRVSLEGKDGSDIGDSALA